jgi:hypothetical protein
VVVAVYPADVATPPMSVSVSVYNGVPVAVELLYRSKVTVPVGLYPPLTVAWSAIDVPTVAVAGCWVVLIAGVAGVIDTGSKDAPLVTEELLLLPLYVATQ